MLVDPLWNGWFHITTVLRIVYVTFCPVSMLVDPLCIGRFHITTVLCITFCPVSLLVDPLWNGRFHITTTTYCIYNLLPCFNAGQPTLEWMVPYYHSIVYCLVWKCSQVRMVCYLLVTIIIYPFIHLYNSEIESLY